MRWNVVLEVEQDLNGTTARNITGISVNLGTNFLWYDMYTGTAVTCRYVEESAELH